MDDPTKHAGTGNAPRKGKRRITHPFQRIKGDPAHGRICPLCEYAKRVYEGERGCSNPSCKLYVGPLAVK